MEGNDIEFTVSAPSEKSARAQIIHNELEEKMPKIRFQCPGLHDMPDLQYSRQNLEQVVISVQKLVSEGAEVDFHTKHGKTVLGEFLLSEFHDEDIDLTRKLAKTLIKESHLNEHGDLQYHFWDHMGVNYMSHYEMLEEANAPTISARTISELAVMFAPRFQTQTSKTVSKHFKGILNEELSKYADIYKAPTFDETIMSNIRRERKRVFFKFWFKAKTSVIVNRPSCKDMQEMFRAYVLSFCFARKTSRKDFIAFVYALPKDWELDHQCACVLYPLEAYMACMKHSDYMGIIQELAQARRGVNYPRIRSLKTLSRVTILNTLQLPRQESIDSLDQLPSAIKDFISLKSL